MTDRVVDITDLQVRRPAFAVEGVSLALPRGAVIGLVGPNGAGKTTVIRALLGLLVPESGEVEVLGHPAGAPPALARIGVVLDQPLAAPEWTVSSLDRRFAPFYPGWDGVRFGELLARLAVPRSQRVGELSRGQGVKLSLAVALAHAPELLILDEPSSGLDPASRRDVGDLIREFMLDPSHTVLFSTHITTDLETLADELVVLVDGRIEYHGGFPDVAEVFAMARGAGLPPVAPLMGLERSGQQWSALIRLSDSAAFGPEVVIDAASVDDIVIHLSAERRAVAA
ncbi:ABC transporter ATP-binding protein [Microbacterium sp. G2-8]|uniref:ABC transporter ATP-binding protein n=1 Tax=Microbacterium sp. G2-8 TaxID=2842454 RepID=UPI001C89A629|nr:ABC transporter ATP-binding protein [Microbacterium sp. G2-8]